MQKVITYKKLKNETETIMSYGDVLSIIEENLGPDIVSALIDFQDEEEEEERNITSYIEDGIFTEQIEESGLIEDLTSKIVNNLKEQGYLKKNKNIDKFIQDEEELIELIDEKLSPGIMNYFEY